MLSNMLPRFLAHVTSGLILLAGCSSAFAQTAPPPDTVKPQGGYKLETMNMTLYPVPGLAEFGGVAMDRSFTGAKPVDATPAERHLKNLRQLSFGNANFGATISPTDGSIAFEARALTENVCEKIFRFSSSGLLPKRISGSSGRMDHPAFSSDGKRIIYASTEGANGGCVRADLESISYVWPIYGSFDLYSAVADGTDVKQLTAQPGFDGFPTTAPDGSILFSSQRSGDIDLFRMSSDGQHIEQMTTGEGFDGLASFTPDGKTMVYCSSRPSGDELREYRELLKKGLYRPRSLEIYIKGSGGVAKPLTTNSGINFAPVVSPDGEWIIFTSNLKDPTTLAFDLYRMRLDGSGLVQITHTGSFNGFAAFSADGKTIVFSSNRNGPNAQEVNLFTADWTE